MASSTHPHKDVVLPVRMPRKLREDLREVAAAEHRTMGAEVRRLIEGRITEARQGDPVAA